MAIKLDLEKAYDRLHWPFISETLNFFGFDQLFITLIEKCVSTSSMAIAWRGEYLEAFNPSRGIRQGDPISPYLFVLCIERLSHLITDACNDGRWKPFQLGRPKLSISHLMFADDVILLSETSLDQAQLIHEILGTFCSASGKKLSLPKSRVFFSHNTKENLASQLSTELGIERTLNLGMYLGVPLLHSRISKENFCFIVDKVRKRLSSWKSKTLSLAGRISLTQSCLWSLPAYVMHTTPIPQGVCKEIEALCRNFIWGSTTDRRKCHLISWDTICSPKEEGGLGFKTLQVINRAYMIKLAWMMAKDDKCLWTKVFRAKYNFSPYVKANPQAKPSSSPTWKSICKEWPLAELGMSWDVGNGNSATFWGDQWIPSHRKLYEFLSPEAPL